MKLYVYCLADEIERLNNPLHGVSGAPVSVMRIEDVAVMVSVDRGGGFPVSRENALAHHEVVRSINKQTTPLPVRFGTIVTEQQLRNYLSTQRQAIKIKLAHVRGCAEMNVRMIGTFAGRDASPARKNKDSQELGPGTMFMLEKRREILRDEAGAAQKSQLSAWLEEKLGDLVKDEKISLVPSASQTVLLARADHLVERCNIQEYRGRMGQAVQERPEARFMVSGPWPPYSFANIELEFSKQFGVS